MDRHPCDACNVERTPEPELMDSAEQAAAYAAADFAAPHNAIAAAFVDRFPELRSGRIIDLGCGAGDMTLRLARALPNMKIVGVDGADAMLELARAAIAEAALTDRIELERRLLPDYSIGTGFDAVFSNSLLHHLHDPDALWSTIRSIANPGTAVFIADLRRPPDTATVDHLVDTYAANEHLILRADFRNSLHAAFTPDEVRIQLGDLPFTVETTSDRHMIIFGTMP